MRRRQRDSRRAGLEEIDITIAREKNFRDEIDRLMLAVQVAREETEHLRRTLVDPLTMVPEDLEAEHERALRKEMIRYKAVARGLLHDLFEAMPEKYDRKDPKWDF